MTQMGHEPVSPVLIDPLRPGPPGEYLDDRVHVVCGPDPDETARPALTATEHFRLYRDGRRLEIRHRLRPSDVDNDLAGLVVDELFTPGWLSGNDIFERVFTGVVRSTVPDPLAAWTTFYDNTLRRIEHAWAEPESPPTASGSGHSLIAGIAPVYAHLLTEVPPGRVLDLGSCFGFLALLLAARPRNTVLASDIVAGSMRLLDQVAAARGLSLETLVCDAARVPLPDGSVDTVTVVHLLEHLDPEHGQAVLAEAMRLAGQRVVVAVPFEDEPAAVYGHVRCFDAAVLDRLGTGTGWRYTVSAFHGGWLVLDRR